MELSKEWKDRAYKIMSTYQKEEGEQEYYMYYDVDVPKMIDKQLQHYANKVEELLRKHIQICEDQSRQTKQTNMLQQQYINGFKKAYEQLLTELTQLKP